MWDGEVGRGEGEGPGAGCLVTFCNCVVLLSCQTSRLTLHTTHTTTETYVTHTLTLLEFQL